MTTIRFSHQKKEEESSATHREILGKIYAQVTLLKDGTIDLCVSKTDADKLRGILDEEQEGD